MPIPEDILVIRVRIILNFYPGGRIPVAAETHTPPMLPLSSATGWQKANRPGPKVPHCIHEIPVIIRCRPN